MKENPARAEASFEHRHHTQHAKRALRKSDLVSRRAGQLVERHDKRQHPNSNRQWRNQIASITDTSSTPTYGNMTSDESDNTYVDYNILESDMNPSSNSGAIVKQKEFGINDDFTLSVNNRIFTGWADRVQGSFGFDSGPAGP